MPKFELEIDDKGEFVGQLAPEVSAIVDRIRTTAHGEGFGKGSQKAAEEARAQAQAAIAAEKAKWEASIPAERAKWEGIDGENKLLREQLQATQTNQRKTLTEREEAHAAEITRRAEREAARDKRIRDLVNKQLRALASASGAREESLPELEVILQHRIGYDDHMDPFVKGEDGQPAKTTAGNPLPLDVFVKQYLDNHPHHRKPTQAAGGGAPGGASFRNVNGNPNFNDAQQRVSQGDRSPDAINDMFNSMRERNRRTA